MPAYAYRCPECGWAGDRFNVSADERDAQRCGRQLSDDDHGPYCDAALEREEIADTARMSYNWGLWES